ncbi:MAG: phosphatase PAP2 family protein [Nevskiaceae bacterium]
MFALLFAAMRLAGDAAVAGLLYDPAAGRWLLDPRLPMSDVLYQGERHLIMITALAGLSVLLAGFWHEGARRWRRGTSYVLICLVATTSLASLGKHTTNVDCPRALAEYGGRYPPIGLFEGRPDAWPRAQCFPAGHSSAAFSFVSLYFVLGAVRPQWRWRGLATGVALGLAFAATQWARGMHVPSHDICSAAIAWAVALATYTVLYRRRL